MVDLNEFWQNVDAETVVMANRLMEKKGSISYSEWARLRAAAAETCRPINYSLTDKALLAIAGPLG